MVSIATLALSESWVQGKINDQYRFDALVFAEYA
jgi:hypothetical protein